VCPFPHYYFDFVKESQASSVVVDVVSQDSTTPLTYLLVASVSEGQDTLTEVC
jgi:hypothetical protein